MHIVYRKWALAGITARSLWCFFNVMAPPRGLGLVVLVDEGEHVVFGQLLWVHPGLGVVNSDPFFPRPEQALRVADTGETKQTHTHKEMCRDSVDICLKHQIQGFPQQVIQPIRRVVRNRGFFSRRSLLTGRGPQSWQAGHRSTLWWSC